MESLYQSYAGDDNRTDGAFNSRWEGRYKPCGLDEGDFVDERGVDFASYTGKGGRKPPPDPTC